jgi:hypothetical protein
MIDAAVGTLTYHIDTPIPRNGDNGVERTEIDTWWGYNRSALDSSPQDSGRLGANREWQLTDDTHVGREVRGTSRSGIV